MASNTNKTDVLHGEIPGNVFKTRTNVNIKALVEASGTQDQFTADLIEEVKRQLFLRTASGKYLDYIGSNNKIERPRLIGLSDAQYRNYISILANNPKQIKSIVDSILDLFYEKAAVYAYAETESASPYVLSDGTYLLLEIDGSEAVRLDFATNDFVSISSATATELALAINKKSDQVFAEVKNDYETDLEYVRIFSKTQGSTGSVRVFGGSTQNALRLEGFVYASPNTTQWTGTLVGDLMTFTRTGGTSPDLSGVSVGDYVSITLSGNAGVFQVEDLDVDAKSFSFRFLLATEGVFTQTAIGQVSFSNASKKYVWHRLRRALTWQPSTGSFDVELPATPILTRNSLQGSSVLNGKLTSLVSKDSSTQLTLSDISDWPTSGYFFLLPNNVILSQLEWDIVETVSAFTSNPFNVASRYSYSGKSGSSLTGISPSLPVVASLSIQSLPAAEADSSKPKLLLITLTAHGLVEGNSVGITDVATEPDYNGCWRVTEVVDADNFYVRVPFTDTSSVSGEGEITIEKAGLAVSGSLAVLSTAIEASTTGIIGPYIWDTIPADNVISSEEGILDQDISAGDSLILLPFSSYTGDFPESGRLIFDFGLESQEGPISFTQKLADGSLLLDSNYVFINPHESGSSVRPLRDDGSRPLDGTEYAPYIADPGIVRALIEELITSTKSSGMFANFLVKYPAVVYSVLDVYNNFDS